MKQIALTLVTVAASSANAARLSLTYPATLNLLYDSFAKIGTRQIKADTEISISEHPTTATAKVSSPVGKTSGISPTQFLAERRTTPTTFVGVGTLDPDPVIYDRKRLSGNTHWCAGLGIYGKTRKAYGLVSCYARKNSQTGKDLYDIMKDGEKHMVLVTIKSFPNAQHPDEVEVTAIKELTEDDPLVKALMATDY